MAGVQAKLLLVDQSLPMVWVVLVLTHHLYRYGGVPPLAIAEKVIVVAAGCGGVLFAVRFITVSGDVSVAEVSFEYGLGPAALIA